MILEAWIRILHEMVCKSMLKCSVSNVCVTQRVIEMTCQKKMDFF